MKTLSALLLAVATHATAHASGFDEWTRATLDEVSRPNAIGYGNGAFVLSATSKSSISQDGITWQPVDRLPGAAKIEFENGQFVGWADKTINISLDGSTWTSRVIPTTLSISDFTAGSGQFLLAGEAGSVWRSTDAIEWTRTAITNVTLIGAAYANGVFFVSGLGADGAPFTMASANGGAQWTKTDCKARIRAVAFGNGLFVAISQDGPFVFTSVNGQNWKGIPDWNSQFRTYDILFVAGRFVVCSSNIGLFTSADGANWISRPVSNLTESYWELVSNGERVVLRTDSAIFYSGKISPDATGLSVSLFPGVTITGTSGRAYRIEATPNLTETNTWNSLATFVLPKSPHTWFDESSPGQPKRFYRALLLP